VNSVETSASCPARLVTVGAALAFVLGGRPGSDQGDGSVVAGTTASGDPAASGSGAVSGDSPVGPTVLDQLAATPVKIRLCGAGPSGLSLDFEVVSPPLQGQLGKITAVDDLTAEVTYTPPGGFTGQSRFLYRATDGAAGSGTRSALIAGCPPVGSELGHHAGARPLTVQARALTASGEPLPEGQYCWTFADEEDCGDVASHGKRMLALSRVSGTLAAGASGRRADTHLVGAEEMNRRFTHAASVRYRITLCDAVTICARGACAARWLLTAARQRRPSLLLPAPSGSDSHSGATRNGAVSRKKPDGRAK